eukprot:2993753-Prymnesium_polylepis.3
MSAEVLASPRPAPNLTQGVRRAARPPPALPAASAAVAPDALLKVFTPVAVGLAVDQIRQVVLGVDARRARLQDAVALLIDRGRLPPARARRLLIGQQVEVTPGVLLPLQLWIRRSCWRRRRRRRWRWLRAPRAFSRGHAEAVQEALVLDASAHVARGDQRASTVRREGDALGGQQLEDRRVAAQRAVRLTRRRAHQIHQLAVDLPV